MQVVEMCVCVCVYWDMYGYGMCEGMHGYEVRA